MDSMTAKIETQWIPIGSDARFSGFLALPPSGSGPGLLLFQEIFGVNDHIQGVALQYALDGFVVLAPDVFWRQKQRVSLGYEGADREEAIRLYSSLQPLEMEDDIRQSADALKARPEAAGRKIGTLGYCLGGRMAFMAAGLTRIDAAVAYYGGGIDKNLQYLNRETPMQFHFAENDHSIPASAVDAVRDAVGAGADIHVHPGTTHGFNCWDRSAYQARASAVAHGQTLQFLGRHLY